MRPRLVVVLAAAVLLSGAAGSAAQEAAAPDLFTVVAEGDASGVRTQRATIMFARQIRVDTDLLLRTTTPGSRLSLDLAPDVRVVAEFSTIRNDEFHGAVWSGTIIGDPMSAAHLVVEGGIVVGTVSYRGRGFDIRPRGRGRGVIVEYDATALPEGNDVLVDPVVDAFEADRGPTVDAEPLANDVTVDLLALYMPEAAKEVGGAKMMKADWKLTVAVMNAALQASGVPMVIRLVGLKKMKYNGPLDNDIPGGAVLKALRTVGDGQMEKAHKFRKKFGADFVSMAIAHTEGICGLGYVSGANSGARPEDAVRAFNIVRSDCVGSYGAFTFGHEGGHNMGLRHNPEDNGVQSGAYPSSFGHRVPGSFRTVMSYSCTTDGLSRCDRAGYFSNPKKTHLGSKTGIKKKRDNAGSLKKDAKVIGAWVGCKKSCGS